MTDKVLSCPTVVEVIRATTNMYRLGWDERNGGNISVILTDEEVKEYIPTKAIRPINVGGVEVKSGQFAYDKNGPQIYGVKLDEPKSGSIKIELTNCNKAVYISQISVNVNPE